MVVSYLKKRSLLYDTLACHRRISITSISCLGVLEPNLWNVFYDSLVRTHMTMHLIGYYDDVSVLIVSRNVQTGQLRLDIVTRRFTGGWITACRWNWPRQRSWSLPRSVYRRSSRCVQEISIEIKTTAQYLGVMIDNKMSFGDHNWHTADKGPRGYVHLGNPKRNVAHTPASTAY